MSRAALKGVLLSAVGFILKVMLVEISVQAARSYSWAWDRSTAFGWAPHFAHDDNV
jgi:hypothetical protein